MRKVYGIVFVVVMSMCVMACGKKDDVSQIDDTQIMESEMSEIIEQETQEEQEEDELEVILGVTGEIVSTDIPETSTEKEENSQSSGSNGTTNKEESSSDKSQDTQSSESNESTEKEDTTEKKEESTEDQGISTDEPIELPFVPAT